MSSYHKYSAIVVAPFVGAWIEIPVPLQKPERWIVAPFVGAWIEIQVPMSAYDVSASLRSSERGLKSSDKVVHTSDKGRSVRRSVD